MTSVASFSERHTTTIGNVVVWYEGGIFGTLNHMCIGRDQQAHMSQGCNLALTSLVRCRHADPCPSRRIVSDFSASRFQEEVVAEAV